MNRCDCARPRGGARLTLRALALSTSALQACARWCWALAAGLAFLTPAQAQSDLPAGHRNFPPHALRGELLVGAVPLALLNGNPARLAPGARIRGDDNLLRLPTSVAGQSLVVHYTLESSSGLLMDVWILNRAELANGPWPTSPSEAATWRFDPARQRWSRP